MVEFDEIIQGNPKAAQELDEMKETLDALMELRRSGFARGSDLRPFRGRQTVNELNPRSLRRGVIKLTADN